MNSKKQKMLIVIGLLFVAIISVFVVSKKASSVQFHEKTLSSLNEKRNTVLELAAASAAASTAITMLPGDTATPVAEKLADLSSYFLVILSAIFLEKYLVTITGYVAFTWLIPISLCGLAAGIVLERSSLKKAAAKIILFGLAFSFVVPVSVKISDLIEKTHHESIAATIEKAKENTDKLEENQQEEGDKGFLSGLISNVEDKVTDTVNEFNQTLNQFIEAIAVLIVTSCMIPIAVIFCFIWLIKTILGIDLKDTPKKAIHKVTKHNMLIF